MASKNIFVVILSLALVNGLHLGSVSALPRGENAVVEKLTGTQQSDVSCTSRNNGYPAMELQTDRVDMQIIPNCTGSSTFYWNLYSGNGYFMQAAKFSFFTPTVIAMPSVVVYANGVQVPLKNFQAGYPQLDGTYAYTWIPDVSSPAYQSPLLNYTGAVTISIAGNANACKLRVWTANTNNAIASGFTPNPSSDFPVYVSTGETHNGTFISANSKQYLIAGIYNTYSNAYTNLGNATTVQFYKNGQMIQSHAAYARTNCNYYISCGPYSCQGARTDDYWYIVYGQDINGNMWQFANDFVCI